MPEQCGLVDRLGPRRGSIRSIAGLRCPYVDGGCRPERFIYSGQGHEVRFFGVPGVGPPFGESGRTLALVLVLKVWHQTLRLGLLRTPRGRLDKGPSARLATG